MKQHLDSWYGWPLLWVLLCMVCPCRVWSQDVQPACPLAHRPLLPSDSLQVWTQQADTVFVPRCELPAAFLRTYPNELLDSLGLLHPFWEKLRLTKTGLSADTLHIVHIGDSHIRGHIFPRTAGACLQQAFGALRYTDMGINGAFCISITRPERIARVVALKPDLLVLSFGTNESHNRRYNAQLHYRQMDDLVRQLRQALPDVPILMTTPPGSYERIRRRSRIFTVNPRTLPTVQTIRRYADDNGLAIWDMYEVFGGVHRAALNWWEAGLMRPDHIHYLPEGYELQGRMFFQAILKAYNRYLTGD